MANDDTVVFSFVTGSTVFLYVLLVGESSDLIGKYVTAIAVIAFLLATLAMFGLLKIFEYFTDNQ